MFICFWITTSNIFLVHLNPHYTKSEFVPLGLVISHAYLSSGILLTRVSFPSLAQILLPRPGELSDNTMADMLVSSPSLYDAAVIHWGMELSEGEFSTELQNLISILSVYDCCEMPKQENIKSLIRKPSLESQLPLGNLCWSSSLTCRLLITGGILLTIQWWWPKMARFWAWMQMFRPYHISVWSLYTSVFIIVTKHSWREM